jgi:hypothetical protein
MSDVRVQERLESPIVARVFAALKHRTSELFHKTGERKNETP